MSHRAIAFTPGEVKSKHKFHFIHGSGGVSYPTFILAAVAAEKAVMFFLAAFSNSVSLSIIYGAEFSFFAGLGLLSWSIDGLKERRR